MGARNHEMMGKRVYSTLGPKVFTENVQLEKGTGGTQRLREGLLQCLHKGGLKGLEYRICL